jgi:5-methylcytosine-specific restriction endonuclease McrA
VSSDARRGRSYRKRRAAVLARASIEGATCYLCGGELRWDVGPYHPLAPETDHVDPLGLGGATLGELLPCHRRCNLQKSDKPLSAWKPIDLVPPGSW